MIKDKIKDIINESFKKNPSDARTFFIDEMDKLVNNKQILDYNIKSGLNNMMQINREVRISELLDEEPNMWATNQNFDINPFETNTLDIYIKEPNKVEYLNLRITISSTI